MTNERTCASLGSTGMPSMLLGPASPAVRAAASLSSPSRYAARRSSASHTSPAAHHSFMQWCMHAFSSLQIPPLQRVSSAHTGTHLHNA
jgi:hypothetical protein